MHASHVNQHVASIIEVKNNLVMYLEKDLIVLQREAQRENYRLLIRSLTSKT